MNRLYAVPSLVYALFVHHGAICHLDLTRVIVVGHSAGGHLAMWVGGRSRLPKTSLVYVSDPLPLRGVVDLAGTPDLEALIPAEQLSCGGLVIEQLLGGETSEVPDHYAQASACKMLPIGVPQTLIWGRRDDNVPNRESFLRYLARS